MVAKRTGLFRYSYNRDAVETANKGDWKANVQKRFKAENHLNSDRVFGL